MPRSALVCLLVVVGLGFAGVLVAGLTTDASRGLDLGVPADYPVAKLGKGHQVCQGPIGLDRDYDVLEFTPTPGGVVGPRLQVRLVDFESRRTLSDLRIAPELMTGGPRRTPVEPGVGGHVVDFCVRHAGGGPPIELYGDRTRGGLRVADERGIHPTLSSSEARIGARELDGDVFVRFPQAPKSVLSQAPVMVERLSRFRIPGPGPVLPWLLLGLTVVVVPAGLWRALRLAADDGEGEGG